MPCLHKFFLCEQDGPWQEIFSVLTKTNELKLKRKIRPEQQQSPALQFGVFFLLFCVKPHMKVLLCAVKLSGFLGELHCTALTCLD